MWTAIVFIVLIGAVSRVACARYGVVKGRRGDYLIRDHAGEAETQRLRDEVRSLKERVAILERIVTDGSTSLDREIERLRERP